MELSDLIAKLKRDGKSALEVQQALRMQGLNIPWLETKKLYLEVK